MSKSQIDSIEVGINSGMYECMVEGPELEVTDSAGSRVITTPPKDFKENVDDALSLQMEFEKPNGETMCRLVAQQYVKFTGGDYALIDPKSEDEIIIFSQTSSFVGSEWEITDGQTSKQLARLKSQGKIGTYLRRSEQFRWILSCTYTIRNSDGNIVGEISKDKFSSKYTIRLQEEAPVKDALIFSPLLIHTFETTR